MRKWIRISSDWFDIAYFGQQIIHRICELIIKDISRFVNGIAGLDLICPPRSFWHCFANTLQLFIFILTIFRHAVIVFPFPGGICAGGFPSYFGTGNSRRSRLIWVLRFLPLLFSSRVQCVQGFSFLKTFGGSFVPFDLLQTSAQFEEKQPWPSHRVFRSLTDFSVSNIL